MSDNKLYLTWQDIEGYSLQIVRAITLSGFEPDYIVGITRGGLTPAVLLSQWLHKPMYTLDVSLRDNLDGMGPESNCWMSEDAFGYIPEEERTEGPFETGTMYSDPSKRKNILIVDDINDSGATLNWIKEDWKSLCLPQEEETWREIFGSNVKFACIVNNEGSDFKDLNWAGFDVNKVENPGLWIVFPWETWWEPKPNV